MAVPLGGAAFARWTTRYLDTAVERLRALPAEAREHDGLNEDVARLSPLKAREPQRAGPLQLPRLHPGWQRRHKAKARRSPTPCHSQRIAHRGPCGKTRVVPQNPGRSQNLRKSGFAKCVCSRVCAPPDCAEQLADMQPC
ncbi:MAG TPA: hypothetical protein VGL88_14675 [Pseudonocardiaceae bacterium]